MSHSHIGIDFGTDHVWAVQLRRAGGAWRPLASACLTRTSPGTAVGEEECRRLGGALARQGFMGTWTVLGVPIREHLSCLVQVPKGDGVAIDGVARMELARVSVCAPDAVASCAWRVPGADESVRSTVMGMGIRTSVAEEMARSMEAGGLRVACVNPRSCALARLTAEAPTINLVVSVGDECLSIVAGNGSEVVYERLISQLGSRALRRDIAARTGMSEPTVGWVIEQGAASGRGSGESRILQEHRNLTDQIGDETLASARYFQGRLGQAAPGRVTVFGWGAEQVAQALRTRFDCPAECGDLRPLIGLESERSSSGFAVTCGLALWKGGE